MTPQQERGRDIFNTGHAESAPITAMLGGGSPVDAALVPCANCHGQDGRGKVEGGVRAADISARALAVDAELPGRRRAAYTPALLKRAITMGYDASGNTLADTMPRFALSQRDADVLLAYFTVLGSEQAAGVSVDAIRMDVLGAPGFVAPDIRIYGRRILVAHERSADALLTIDVSDNADVSLERAEHDHMPTIAVLSRHAAPGAHAFLVTATQADQVAALQREALRRNSDYVLLTTHCTIDWDAGKNPLILMSAQAAANCDASTLPAAPDRRVIVAVAAPAEVRGDAGAASLLAFVVDVLSSIGHDVTRSALIVALEHVRQAKLPGLPPITWNANRHVGTHSVLLMSVDLRRRELLADPGWALEGSE